MVRRQSDPKSDYRYDFFKPVYSSRKHYTVDFYYKKVSGKCQFLAELQLYPDATKEPLMIEEKESGKFEIVSETGISEDLRKKILELITKHSQYYGKE